MRTFAAILSVILLSAQPVCAEFFAPSTPTPPVPQPEDRVPQGVRVVPRPPDRDLSVTISTDRKNYVVGDSVAVRFRTTEDAYVYIFSVDARGESRQIFPNYWDQDNFVRGGTSYSIPDGSYDLVAEPPYGAETLSIVAVPSRSGIPPRYGTFSQSDPFPSASRAEMLKVVPRGPRHGHGGKIAEASTTIYIRGERWERPPYPRPPYRW